MIFSITKRFIHQTFVIVIIISHLTYQSGIEKKPLTLSKIFLLSHRLICVRELSAFLFFQILFAMLFFICASFELVYLVHIRRINIQCRKILKCKV